MVVKMVVNLEFRFVLLVFVESDEFTKAQERHQTEDNEGKRGSGGAVHCRVAVPSAIFRVIDRLVLVLID